MNCRSCSDQCWASYLENELVIIIEKIMTLLITKQQK